MASHPLKSKMMRMTIQIRFRKQVNSLALCNENSDDADQLVENGVGAL